MIKYLDSPANTSNVQTEQVLFWKCHLPLQQKLTSIRVTLFLKYRLI